MLVIDWMIIQHDCFLISVYLNTIQKNHGNKIFIPWTWISIMHKHSCYTITQIICTSSWSIRYEVRDKQVIFYCWKDLCGTIHNFLMRWKEMNDVPVCHRFSKHSFPGFKFRIFSIVKIPGCFTIYTQGVFTCIYVCACVWVLCVYKSNTLLMSVYSSIYAWMHWKTNKHS